MSHHPTTLASRDQAALLVVDVQEKLFPLVRDQALLLPRLAALVKGATALGLPILTTEQYPAGLGPTVPTLASLVPGPVVTKQTFSCFGEASFVRALRETRRTQVVVCGIETHICVLQTALDALAEGYDVFLVEDAVGSRAARTHEIAIDRMRAAGAHATSVEGVLYELVREAGGESFKAVLSLVKEGF